MTTHGESAYRVAVSPDGNTLMSSGFDGKVRLTDAATGLQILKIHVGGRFLNSADFSPDGTLAAGGPKTISVWEAGTKNRISRCKGHTHDVHATRFSPDSTRLATASGERWLPKDLSVRIWEARSGTQLSHFKFKDNVTDVVWQDDQNLIALVSGCDVRELWAIALDSGRCSSIMSLDRQSEAMALHAPSHRLLLERELINLKTLKSQPVPHGGMGAAMSVDGKRMATGIWCEGDSVVTVWDARLQAVSRFLLKHRVYSMCFSPDGRSLFTSDGGGHIRGWDAKTGTELWGPDSPAPSASTAPKAASKKKAGGQRPKLKASKSASSRASKGKQNSGNSNPNVLFFADAFGVTRLVMGKKPKLKTTTKVSAPGVRISFSEAGKIALVDAHRVSLLTLPRLGVLEQPPSPGGRLALLHQARDPELVSLVDDELRIHQIVGDEFRELRRFSLGGKTSNLGQREVGPQQTPDPEVEKQTSLCVSADGTFAALSGGRLRAGQLGQDAGGDVVWWTLELAIIPSVAVGLNVLEEEIWLKVMDHAGDQAHLLAIDRSGKIESHTLDSLSLPEPTATHILYQPASDTVVRRSRVDAQEQAFSVKAHNRHPYRVPKEFFRGRAPAAPKRLPGQLRALGEHAFFVPWHGEFVVELLSSQRFDRGLVADMGPLRRGLLEILARDNLPLAKLQMQLGFRWFSMEKRRTYSLEVTLPPHSTTLSNLVAEDLMDFSERFQLRANGWSYGILPFSRGVFEHLQSGDLAEVERTLAWMREADRIPLEVSAVGKLYAGVLGIPHQNPHAKPLDSDAERLWLRATLETIRSGGWALKTLPAKWASTTIKSAMAIKALAGLSNWKRFRPTEGLHMLCCVLVRHLDSDALPVLLHLMADRKPFNHNQYRHAGELLVWLCHKHPKLKTKAEKRLLALKSARSWNYKKQTVLEALQGNARHLWS